MCTTLVHQQLYIARRALRLFGLAAMAAAVVSCSGAATNRPKQHPFLPMAQHPTRDDKPELSKASSAMSAPATDSQALPSSLDYQACRTKKPS